MRLAYGLSQRNVVIAMEVPQITLKQWEQSRRMPTNVTGALLMSVLSINECGRAEEWMGRPYDS